MFIFRAFVVHTAHTRAGMWAIAQPSIPYRNNEAVKKARAAVDDAKKVVAAAMTAKRNAEKTLTTLLDEENKRVVAAGGDPEWCGNYCNGTGRYEEAWRHLEGALVPPSGDADTHVGNVLRGFMKLFYRLNNDGDEPYDYYNENTDYFTDMCVTATDLALDDSPMGRTALDDDDAQAAWVEAFLANLLSTYALPASVFPLPGPIPEGSVAKRTDKAAPAKTSTKRQRTSSWY